MTDRDHTLDKFRVAQELYFEAALSKIIQPMCPRCWSLRWCFRGYYRGQGSDTLGMEFRTIKCKDCGLSWSPALKLLRLGRTRGRVKRSEPRTGMTRRPALTYEVVTMEDRVDRFVEDVKNLIRIGQDALLRDSAESE